MQSPEVYHRADRQRATRGSGRVGIAHDVGDARDRTLHEGLPASATLSHVGDPPFNWKLTAVFRFIQDARESPGRM